jgi:hypothetical protein
MGANTRCLVRLIIFFILGTDRVILEEPILITLGGFQKILRIAREQILRELIVWEIVFDAKSLRSGIFFEQKTETYGPLSL